MVVERGYANIVLMQTVTVVVKTVMEAKKLNIRTVLIAQVV